LLPENVEPFAFMLESFFPEQPKLLVIFGFWERLFQIAKIQKCGVGARKEAIQIVRGKENVTVQLSHLLQVLLVRPKHL
jgi:hypothetical protein